MNTYWISLSDPSVRRGFQGVVIIDADSPEEGIDKAIDQGLLPENVFKLSIKVWQLKEGAKTDYSSYKNRLLKREDLTEIGTSTLESEEN